MRFSKALGNKWQGIDETWETGCPILLSALAVFECKTANTHVGSDHVFFIGEVLNADYDPKGRPLLFHRGRYARVVPED